MEKRNVKESDDAGLDVKVYLQERKPLLLLQCLSAVIVDLIPQLSDQLPRKTDQSITKSSNYFLSLYGRHQKNALSTALMPLPEIIMDGREEPEASQCGVMNWTCIVALGVRLYCS